MDTNQPNHPDQPNPNNPYNQQTPPVYTNTYSTTTTTDSPGMFGTKTPSAIAFLVGILVFLLPFAEIRCGDTKIMSKTGLDYAMGNEWKTVAGGMGTGAVQDKSMDVGKEQKGNTQYYVIGALALGVIGLILAFTNARTAGGGGLVTGLLAAGTLVGFMLELKRNFANSLRDQAIDKAAKGADSVGMDGISNTMGDIKPTLALTPWFYIAIIAFIAAAIFSYMRMKTARRNT